VSGTYPPIGDYGFIGDCHSAALVSRQGSVDWCCLPRFDAGDAFGRLLDWGKGGFCSVEPTTDDYEVFREYLPGTLVLVTSFATNEGRARLTDCFTMRAGGAHQPRHQLLRVVEGTGAA